jgi:L-fuconolactonase
MPGSQIIDAHHHFWHYNPEEYGWIGESMLKLRRNFLPSDLEPELAAGGVHAVVTVQARQTLVETEWLLSLAKEHPWMAGVVGWIPLTSSNAAAHLEHLSPHPKLKGVRHILHDEADDNYMLRPDFLAGIKELRRFHLAYDILIFERHLPQSLQLVDRFPNQVFVLDHIAKPRIKAGAMEPWRTGIIELAKRPNVYCKLSGMVTEADWNNWSFENLRPYFETVLKAFGPKRLMFGSDWPVLLMAGTYHSWLQTVLHVIEPLSESERARIMGGTAREAYRLSV